MNFTIFGYPRTGKTTLFNLLTGADVQFGSTMEGKKDINRRTCPVPDPRLDALAEIYPGKEKKPAVVDYHDLAGISCGEVKESTFLDQLRRADGLTHVVRAFKNPQVPPPEKASGPAEDIQSMEEELLLSDLLQIENRLEKLEGELQKTKNPEGEKERDVLKRLHSCLEEGRAIGDAGLSPSEEKIIRSFAFLTQKPLLHMVNIDEDSLPLTGHEAVLNLPVKIGASVMAFCGKIELELMALDEEEKNIFMKEYGIRELSAGKYLKKSFEMLRVISFYTIGDKEVKAWTIAENTTAPQAAGAVHTDMEKGFIKAEVINWKDLARWGSLAAAREKAGLRLEGKDYIVRDGDVITFRFSR